VAGHIGDGEGELPGDVVDGELVAEAAEVDLAPPGFVEGGDSWGVLAEEGGHLKEAMAWGIAFLAVAVDLAAHDGGVVVVEAEAHFQFLIDAGALGVAADGDFFFGGEIAVD
jgi:hypothetical protein